ncbi:MAG: helix-turn-helix domain-containing protein, partial [Polyangiaceae bacterium]
MAELLSLKSDRLASENFRGGGALPVGGIDQEDLMTDAGLTSSHTHHPRYAGIRRMSPALYQGAEDADAFEGLPEDQTHWDVFWHLDRAATPMGFSRAEIDTLRVLWKYSQAQDWRPGSRPIVWPSNETLMLELGLSRTALKYRLRCLASKRLVAFRDSPTGKRYGHRDHAGELILSATYVIDLAAAVRRLEECRHAAERHELERGLRRELRRRRTIAVKATRQAIETA